MAFPNVLTNGKLVTITPVLLSGGGGMRLWPSSKPAPQAVLGADRYAHNVPAYGFACKGPPTFCSTSDRR
jgi:hypothetical protein